MSQADGSRTPYEVYCTTCNVSHPLGSKRCLHCGGRLAPNRYRQVLDVPPTAEEVMEEESPIGRGGFSPMTLIWVVLLVAGYLYRACAGG